MREKASVQVRKSQDPSTANTVQYCAVCKQRGLFEPPACEGDGPSSKKRSGQGGLGIDAGDRGGQGSRVGVG